MAEALPTDSGGSPQVSALRAAPSAAVTSTTGDQDSRVALDILRELAGQEIVRSERLSGRARQAAALAAGVFAVAQTVAFGAFAASNLSRFETRSTLALAAIAIVFVGVTAWQLLAADSPFPARNLDPDEVLNVINETRLTGESAVDEFVTQYVTAVSEMRRANRLRHAAVVRVQVIAMLAVVAVVAEVGYSLYARST